MSRHHQYRIGGERSSSDGSDGDGDRGALRRRQTSVGIPSVVSISVIEGRGIWLLLEGSLIAGRSDRAHERLVRLGELGFAEVVVDVSALIEIDASGCEIFERFVGQVADGKGAVRVIDPDGLLRAVRPHDALTVMATAPDPIWGMVTP